MVNLLNSLNDESYGSSMNGISKLEERLKKIKNHDQWESFLHTVVNFIPLRKRDGVAIRVQPTTIVRRTAGISKGSKRLPAGRPPLGEKTAKKKRKRILGLSINLNTPNAKSHGPM